MAGDAHGAHQCTQQLPTCHVESFEGLDFVKVYMDDVLLHSRSEQEHLVHLQEVFARLHKYKFYLKLCKCQFFL